MLLADRVDQPGPAHPVADRAADLGEPELDARGRELGGERGQHVGRGHVEIRGRPDVEDDRTGPGGSRPDERDDLVLRDIGVHEGQRHVRTQQQEALDRLGRRVAIGVGEDRRRARDPTEDRDVRPAGLVEDRQQ